MAEQTGIAWCDSTFNAWIGCTKVSAACDFCYAEKWGERFGVKWGNHPRRKTSASYWKQPLKWDRQAKASGVRKRVFCSSLADVFDNQVPDEWRAELWDLIGRTPNIDWLLLTKRPQNIANMLPKKDNGRPSPVWPWKNVWLGMTAENQKEFDRRYQYLAAVPAAVHFISYEPALGPLSISGVYPVPDWIICGSESGPGARPCNLEWVRSIRDQCSDAGVAFFWKQHIIGGKKIDIPALDGRQWVEFPS